MSQRVFLVGLLCLALAGCQASKASLSNDKLIGNQIVDALDRYKADRGSYPKQLIDLVPNYLSAITPPGYGQKKWDYFEYPEQGAFVLCVSGRKVYQDTLWFDSTKREWEIVENSF
jgi:hypothetical protein